MKKISVIVPIYNVEKHIGKCIESILKQGIEILQLILVNDGSTDSSGQIAKRYAEKYPDTIIYLEKENGGLSDARNYALPYVNGDYIAFVDSDDYLSEDLFKNLEQYLEQDYDMVKIKINKVDETGKKIAENYSPIFENKTGEEAFDILYKSDVMTEVAWGYLYKKDFFMDNKFKYEKGLYHEDFGLTPLVILKAKKVAATNIDGYNYVQTTNSITRGNSETILKRNMDLLTHYDNMMEKIKDYNISEKSKENIKIYYTNCIILAISNLKDKSQKESYIQEIKKRKMYKNIKARNLKQLIKKIILNIDVNLYLKMR